MCNNLVRYSGETVNCGTRITHFNTDGKRKIETVLCYGCVKDAALRWSMEKCEAYLDEFWDTEELIEIPVLQAA